MADGSYFGFEPILSDDPLPLMASKNMRFVCADCGCDRFQFQPDEKESSD